MDITTLLILALVVCVLAGILSTRLVHLRNERKLIRGKLEAIFEDHNPTVEDFTQLTETRTPSALESSQFFEHLTSVVALSGANITPGTLLTISGGILVLPAVVALAIDGPVLLVALVSLPLALVPYGIMRFMAEHKRTKFVQQLPDALDLMISVLRCGLSVPQAIKSIGDEMPAPIGPEFIEVLHRINLGQSLTESLSYTVEKYRVFELDLVRRAAAIQLEVGGSLADLLEKTNTTLRQRIKLKRTVKVLTASSRLSGTIIAILPFVIVGFFYVANPAYLDPLVTTNIGKILLVVAFAFQFTGIFVITKMASFKV